jgi:hypothetical protein
MKGREVYSPLPAAATKIFLDERCGVQLLKISNMVSKGEDRLSMDINFYEKGELSSGFQGWRVVATIRGKHYQMSRVRH